MPLPKVILVPSDFGAASDAALDQAIELARAFGAKPRPESGQARQPVGGVGVEPQLVLLHVYEVPIVGFPDGALVATADLTAQIVEGAQAGLEHQIATREGEGVSIRGIIKQGDPYRMINETADEVGADLIVMGTHGRHGIARMLIGSVAEKVVRTSKVPVMTIRPESGEARQPLSERGAARRPEPSAPSQR